jgi:site-specific DNA recombinase
MPRVAFYTRISTDETIQKYSLAAQEERLEAYCKGQFGDDWTLFNVYRDSASGTTMERPELQRMVADARDRQFDLLMVFRVDRFSRRVGELAMLAAELKSYGVDLKSATEPIDTSSPAGMMIFQTLGVFAEFEQKSIVERTKVGMLKKAKTGSWPGGRVPLGYKFDAERGLQVDETAAPIVRRVFGMYVEGQAGSSAIAQDLNRAGFRTRTGKKFGRKAVLDILRNVMYRGQFMWQKQAFDSTHEPIISVETFEAAGAILQKRSDDAPGKRWHNQDDRILSGLVRCGCCRSRMVGVSANKKGQKHSYYACTKRLESKECDQEYVRAEWLEQQIMADIQKVFRDEELLEEVWQSAQQQLAATAPDLDSRIQAVDHQRTQTQAALDRYFRAFETGAMTPAACQQRVEELTNQARQLDDERATLQEQREALDLPALRTDFLHEILTNLAAVVDAVSNAQKKHLLRLLVEKVLIQDRCTFAVWYRLPQFPAVRTLSHLVAPTGLEPVLPP